MDQPGRRTVLAVVVGAAVAGCTKYGEPNNSTNSGNSPSQSAPANVVLAKTAEIPVGGGLIFAASQVVVTQPAEGSFKAFTSICTHQGCQVATVAGGTINCDCHGSKYAIADGSVVHGPAPLPLAPKQITISGGSITLT